MRTNAWKIAVEAHKRQAINSFVMRDIPGPFRLEAGNGRVKHRQLVHELAGPLNQGFAAARDRRQRADRRPRKGRDPPSSIGADAEEHRLSRSAVARRPTSRRTAAGNGFGDDRVAVERFEMTAERTQIGQRRRRRNQHRLGAHSCRWPS